MKVNRMKLLMSDRPLPFVTFSDEAYRYVDLSSLKISNCVGCFGCWVSTGRTGSSVPCCYILGCSQGVRQRTLTPSFRAFESRQPSHACDEQLLIAGFFVILLI